MKHTLKKYLPKVSDLTTKYKVLGVFGSTILHPDLWKIRRQPCSVGVAVGLFWCLIPMPFQMIMAALFSLLLRSNLPISLLLCWISNPITMAPLFYFNYRVGIMLLEGSVLEYKEIAAVDNISQLLFLFGNLWQPLYFGSIVLALIFAVCGYMLSTFLWKLVIVRQWHNRNNRHHKQ